MITKETEYLSLLKDELDWKYKETYPESSLKITEWRQQEIIRFQKLMQEVVKGRISEKWFYTHIKTEKNIKMPRVDTLNLLAEFLGYNSWENFKKEKGQIKKIQSVKHKEKIFLYKNRFILIIIILFVIATSITYSTGVFNKTEHYKFCFVDADTDEPILNSSIEVSLLHHNQSPEIIKCDENSCFEIEIDEKRISFVVKAMYYKTDTLTRVLDKKNTFETVKLKQDDYALMIHVFSTSKINDWQKQRKKLDKIIADDAEIYQIDKKERGIEIYNKEEFIDKMTIPLNSLKNIEIIEVTYKNDKILMMRFIQK